MSDEFDSNEQAFIARAKRVLDRAVGEIDPDKAVKLQRARISAMQSRASWNRRWAWNTGLAIVSVAAVALVLWMNQPPSGNHAAVPLEDFELVMSGENLELAEDLEFYHWLANEDSTG